MAIGNKRWIYFNHFWFVSIVALCTNDLIRPTYCIRKSLRVNSILLILLGYFFFFVSFASSVLLSFLCVICTSLAYKNPMWKSHRLFICNDVRPRFDAFIHKTTKKTHSKNIYDMSHRTEANYKERVIQQSTHTQTLYTHIYAQHVYAQRNRMNRQQNKTWCIVLSWMWFLVSL